jgi:hypothetical protein
MKSLLGRAVYVIASGDDGRTTLPRQGTSVEGDVSERPQLRPNFLNSHSLLESCWSGHSNLPRGNLTNHVSVIVEHARVEGSKTWSNVLGCLAA